MFGAVVLLALLDVNGFVALRGVNATGPPSWLEEDFGRLGAGGDGDVFVGVAGAEVDWSPSRFLTLRASGIARRDPLGTRAGIVEAYADVRVERGLNEVRLRAGHFFLPTSRENRDALWQSPYSVAFSAVNSWIGEEVRPLGLDLQYRHVNAAGHALTAGATAFRGNDTMGTLLAWRGWAIGDRLSTYGETLPLPPIASLEQFFVLQRDGTQPFGADLDGRTGWSARVRWSLPERANVQYAYVDNAGDRELYGDEYAWATRFHLVSAELGDPNRAIVAAEYLQGTTGMGGRFRAFVDADVYAAYLLVSAKYRRHRLTGRYEIFGSEEADFTPAERNEENGRAWTFAWLFDLTPSTRLAAEFTQFVGHRAETRELDARTVTVEARYQF